uniref:Class I SAM-dependent methyltransferase n=1 Tax=Archaeoglobus fulgidus TaxID=2234 RepID=A0A7J2TJD2_ARCFL
MPHKFSYKNADLLDSEERRKIFPPDRVLGILDGVKMRKEVAFDIGAGTGYLTIPLARIFKRVYAVEISHEMAEILNRRLMENGISNVGIIVTEKPPEVDFKIDLVVFSNVLHEMENPKEYLQWSKKASYVLVAEWKKIQTEFGPPVDERISLEEILSLCDFEVLKKLDLQYHYVALLKTKV